MVLAVRCASGGAPCCSMRVKHSVPVGAEIKMMPSRVRIKLQLDGFSNLVSKINRE